MPASTSLSLLLVTASALLIFRLIKNVLKPGLRHIPGPFAAKLSNLYRLLSVYRGDNQVSLCQLHEKYGDNVRFGPNVVSISNIKDVNKVYGVRSSYKKVHKSPKPDVLLLTCDKSPFYLVQQQLVRGRATQTIFTTIDEQFHAKIKRPVANAYAMSVLTDYEPLVDRSIMQLVETLGERYSDTENLCPIFEWLQYYAFDVIGELTCSESFGFMDKGGDVGSIIESLNTAMDYNAIIGQVPWMDLILKKNPLLARIQRPTGAIAEFARQRLNLRLMEARKGSPKNKDLYDKRDFVDRFLAAKESHPAVVDDEQVFSYMVTNMFAGSDTTAISLRAILYYTLKHPDVYSKLMVELENARATGSLSLPAKWHESQQLVYFDCVAKEALRLHPAVGLILERIVPETGLDLECGTTLPAGTIVGASPWVIHRNKDIFGPDADHFRPERWLAGPDEDAASYDARLKTMMGATMTFGKGHRTCIGKNISLLEIYKLLPTLFLMYHIELDKATDCWTMKNSWFVRQEGVSVLLKRRTLIEPLGV